MSNKDDSCYSVGYGKPPRHTQFQPGRSGNPKGRPKTSRDSDTLLRNALLETVTATENGRAQKMTKAEAILTRLVNNAVMGDPRYVKLLIGRIDSLTLFKSGKRRGGVSEVIKGLRERLCASAKDHVEKAEIPNDPEVLSAPQPATEPPAEKRSEEHHPSLDIARKEHAWPKPLIIGHRLRKGLY